MSQVAGASYNNFSPQTPLATQSDGWYREVSTGDAVLFVAGNEEMRRPLSRNCVEFCDFNGLLTVSSGVLLNNGPWTTYKSAAAGTVTLGADADASHGALKMGYDNTNEAQIIALYWGDEQTIKAANDAILEFRAKVDATPHSTNTIVMGFASAYNATQDNVATNAWFRLSGATLAINMETDDGTTDTDDKAPDSALTLTAGTYYEFKIDLTTLTNVLFYTRTTLGGSWTSQVTAGTTFTIGASTANLQPYFLTQKSANTQTTSNLFIDYAKVRWLRD